MISHKKIFFTILFKEKSPFYLVCDIDLSVIRLYKFFYLLKFFATTYTSLERDLDASGFLDVTRLNLFFNSSIY